MNLHILSIYWNLKNTEYIGNRIGDNALKLKKRITELSVWKRSLRKPSLSGSACWVYVAHPGIQQLDNVQGFHNLTGVKWLKQTGARPQMDPTAWLLKEATELQRLGLGLWLAEQRAGSWAFPHGEMGWNSSGEKEGNDRGAV